MLKKFEKNETEKILEILNICLKGSDCGRYVAQVVSEFASRGLLGDYSGNDIAKIIDLLDRCADEAHSEKSVAKAILDLALKKLLGECDEQSRLKILNILYSCAYQKSAQPYASKANIELAEKNSFGSTIQEQEIMMSMFDMCGYAGGNECNMYAEMPSQSQPFAEQPNFFESPFDDDFDPSNVNFL